MKIRSILAGAAFAAAVAMPGLAAAATAYATGNVNLRAGPGTQYPVATTVSYGSAVQVFGCLSDYSWCDIGYAGFRGWSSGRYLQQAPGRILVPAYARQIGIPVVGFSVGTYWDRNYRGRSFYRDRDRYTRQDRREIRGARENLQDRRDRINNRIETARDNGNTRRVERLRDRRQNAREQFREEREDITCQPGGVRCVRN